MGSEPEQRRVTPQEEPLEALHEALPEADDDDLVAHRDPEEPPEELSKPLVDPWWGPV